MSCSKAQGVSPRREERAREHLPALGLASSMKEPGRRERLQGLLQTPGGAPAPLGCLKNGLGLASWKPLRKTLSTPTFSEFEGSRGLAGQGGSIDFDHRVIGVLERHKVALVTKIQHLL